MNKIKFALLFMFFAWACIMLTLTGFPFIVMIVFTAYFLIMGILIVLIGIWKIIKREAKENGNSE